MGCGPSKDAVKAIEIENGKVREKSGKIRVVSSDESLVNESNATRIGASKSTSAKSRDSGIEEMDYGRSLLVDGVITEESDPHLVQDIEGQARPNTPEFELVGRQFHNKSAGRERLRSKAILQELEAEGLISGSKVEKGGAAFEVSISPLQPLEPLAPICRPPPRLQKLKSEKKIPSKEELEEKMRQAESRRKRNLDKKSRLASQLARDQALAHKMTDDDHEFDSSDNADVVTRQIKRQNDHGQGESGNFRSVSRTIFDDRSDSSDEDIKTPGLGTNNSSDSFFKETASRSNSFSSASAMA